MISYSLAPSEEERFVVDLSNFLVLQGHEVYILTTNSDDLGHNSFYLPKLSKEVKYINLKAKSGHAIRALLGVSKYIRVIKPDIVHSHADLIQLLLPLLTNRRPKYLHTIHYKADYYFSVKKRNPLFKYIYSTRVYAITTSLACSEYYRSFLGINKDIIIDNGQTNTIISNHFGDVPGNSGIKQYDQEDSMSKCAGRYLMLYKAATTNCYMLSNWARNKELTWSGTNWGLLNALQKRIPLGDIGLEKIKPSLSERILRKIGISVDPDLGLSQMSRQRKALANRDLRGIILQFNEVIEDRDDLKTYIYQDSSVDYLYYIYQNHPEVFAFSSFQNIKPEYIERRRILQNDYYMNRCKGIFTMGNWLRLDLINRTGIDPSKVFAVGGGLNLDPSLISDKPKERRRILFVGRDFQRKGGPLTISAFRLLKQKMPEAELYVAGPASDPIGGEGLPGYHFMGDCNHEQLSQLFNLCDIFCMPSIFEAYGLVFIEALCYGLPCIGRDRYEMPFFIEDGRTGLLMKGDTPDELCSYMNTLLNEGSFYDNVKLNRPKYLSEYSWDSVADRILNVMFA